VAGLKRLFQIWMRRGWKWWQLPAAVLLGLLALFVCRGAWLDLGLTAWRDEEQSHILLVSVVAAWLVWVRRGRLRRCRPGGGGLGLALVLAGGPLTMWGYHSAIYTFWYGGAVLVLVGAVLAVLGSDLAWAFAPALGVLAFLVPVPGTLRQQIALPLQTITAQVTQQIFDLGGIAVERSGNLLSINGVDVTIVDACNGLRMVFALALVSFAFAFGTPLRGYVRLVVLVLSPLSAVVCNVIRLVPTLWIYGYYNAWAKGFHDVSGWLMLPLAFLLLMGIIRALRWALVPVQVFTLAYD